ncbi:Uncharacterized protein Fot_06502 [Forsythia ovata]|uniref:Uncharacterized protein n=1 Tax=Forsythia ovata TaxID=205694 RepID=A0ABD1WT62_9LAMI
MKRPLEDDFTEPSGKRIFIAIVPRVWEFSDSFLSALLGEGLCFHLQGLQSGLEILVGDCDRLPESKQSWKEGLATKEAELGEYQKKPKTAENVISSLKSKASELSVQVGALQHTLEDFKSSDEE